MLYGLRSDGLQAIGVNVDPDRISAVISDLSGAVRAEAVVDCKFAQGQRAFVAALELAVAQVLAGTGREQLAGIGVAVPATVRHSAKGIFAPTDDGDWSGIDLATTLGDRFGLTVVAENRAHAVGVGEYLFGAGRGASDLLCLRVGSGLGAAVIADGRLFTGGDGGAGALGRIAVGDPKRPGHRPVTVSDLVGAAAIARAAADRRRAGLSGADASTRMDADAVIDLALAGDADMVDVLADVGRQLGAVVATALCVVDSDLVLLCGPTMRAGELVAGPLRDEVRSRFPFAAPDIRLGQLGRRAGPLGAAALVLTGLIRESALDPSPA